MKKIIVFGHLMIGVILIVASLVSVYDDLKLALRTDFSTSFSAENWILGCVKRGGQLAQCTEQSKEVVNNEEKAEKDKSEWARKSLFSIFNPINLGFLVAFISIIAAYGFWENKKWSSVALGISFLANFFSMMFSIPFLMLGGTELTLILLWIVILILLASIALQIIERRYLKRHWSEFN